MVLDWLDVGGRWLGPPRGGGKGNREAQRKREANKRKIARAKARAARDAAGEVVNKRWGGVHEWTNSCLGEWSL